MIQAYKTRQFRPAYDEIEYNGTYIYIINPELVKLSKNYAQADFDNIIQEELNHFERLKYIFKSRICSQIVRIMNKINTTPNVNKYGLNNYIDIDSCKDSFLITPIMKKNILEELVAELNIERDIIYGKKAIDNLELSNTLLKYYNDRMWFSNFVNNKININNILKSENVLSEEFQNLFRIRCFKYDKYNIFIPRLQLREYGQYLNMAEYISSEYIAFNECAINIDTTNILKSLFLLFKTGGIISDYLEARKKDSFLTELIGLIDTYAEIDILDNPFTKISTEMSKLNSLNTEKDISTDILAMLLNIIEYNQSTVEINLSEYNLNINHLSKIYNLILDKNLTLKIEYWDKITNKIVFSNMNKQIDGHELKALILQYIMRQLSNYDNDLTFKEFSGKLLTTEVIATIVSNDSLQKLLENKFGKATHMSYYHFVPIIDDLDFKIECNPFTRYGYKRR